MSVIALIVAAGRGSRMSSGLDIPKQYLSINGKTILRRSIEAFTSHPLVENVIVVIHEKDLDLYRESVIGIDILDPIVGGATRQESVKRGLEALVNLNPLKVLIHDAARPFVDKKIISNIINELDYSDGAIPAVPIEDTIKKGENGRILWTVDRANLWRAQTPQGFIYQNILQNHEKYKNSSFTDDCAIAEHAEVNISIISGSQNNFKITTDSDYERAESFILSNALNKITEIRIGHGYDLHKFSEERSNSNYITLGCTNIPYYNKIEAHSDGDVVSHAIVDSLLGAMGKGDIGYYFPPTEEKWKGVSSVIFLEKVKAMLKSSLAKIGNMDITIITEQPKIGPYRDLMVANLSKVLDIDKERINVKAKTKEGLGPVGQGCAIEAFVVSTIYINTISE